MDGNVGSESDSVLLRSDSDRVLEIDLIDIILFTIFYMKQLFKEAMSLKLLPSFNMLVLIMASTCNESRDTRVYVTDAER